MKKYRLRRPVLVALTAAVTAGVTLNLPAAEAETPAPAPQTVAVIDLYQQDTPPAYTAEMVASWHEWQPTGKAAGVVPVGSISIIRPASGADPGIANMTRPRMVCGACLRSCKIITATA